MARFKIARNLHKWAKFRMFTRRRDGGFEEIEV